MRETRRQEIIGTVISDRMDKTIVVQVETQKMHPQYKKFIKRRKNYKVHDETNECKLGDTVRCASTRPISKDKHFRVSEILTRKYVSIEEVVEPEEMVMKKQHPANQAAKQEAE